MTLRYVNVAKTDADAVKKMRGRLSALKSVRQPKEGLLRSVRDFILPMHSTGLTQGAVVNEWATMFNSVVDGAGIQSAMWMAAGLMAGTSSPSRPWFKLTTPDPGMANFYRVKLWLEQVEERMRFVMAQSNLYKVMHNTYLETGVFGTGAQMVFEDIEKGVMAQPLTIGEYWVGCDASGAVDALYRRLTMTVGQVVEKYGYEAVSDKVRQQYNRDNVDEQISVIIAIEKNDGRVKLADMMNRPWRSVHFEENATDHGDLLDVRGFDECPFQVPRWHTVGVVEPYGVGLGMIVLGKVKLLEHLVKKTIKGVDMMIDPPLTGPADLNPWDIDMRPGGYTPSNPMSPHNALRPIVEARFEVGAAFQMQDRLVQKIGEGMFNNLFLMLANDTGNQRMTAREVAERHEEKMLMLGPVLERLQGEMLEPMIERVFGILQRKGMIPPAPPELEGQALRIDYVSILAQAQKMMDLSSYERGTAFIGQLAAVSPEALDTLNITEVAKGYWRSVGGPMAALRDDDEIAQIRDSRAQQQQQAQMMAMAPQMAKAGKDVAGIPGAMEMLMGGSQ